MFEKYNVWLFVVISIHKAENSLGRKWMQEGLQSRRYRLGPPAPIFWPCFHIKTLIGLFECEKMYTFALYFGKAEINFIPFCLLNFFKIDNLTFISLIFGLIFRHSGFGLL